MAQYGPIYNYAPPAGSGDEAALTVVLVSCVSRKADRPLPACDLYRSTWFKYARRYAERYGDRWFLLSAKYGLVRPDEVIYPYNQTIDDMNKQDRRQWAIEVERDICRRVGSNRARIIFLAGKRYRVHLAQWLALAGHDVLSPLKCLGIGQQIAWLKAQTETANG